MGCGCTTQVRWLFGHRNMARKRESPGMANTRVYRIWKDMNRRCHNPNRWAYKYYGGRGINVCKEWETSFLAFLRDLGQPPSAVHVIDRIDNDKGYFKNNCRWVLPSQSRQNQRRNKLTIAEARQIRELKRQGIIGRRIAELFGISQAMVSHICLGRKWKEMGK